MSLSRIDGGVAVANAKLNKIMNKLEEIEILVQHKPEASPTNYIPLGLVIELLDAMNSVHKIEAIKAVRTMTACGLKEAKDLVEKYF
jgi:hypothetical protein